MIAAGYAFSLYAAYNITGNVRRENAGGKRAWLRRPQTVIDAAGGTFL